MEVWIGLITFWIICGVFTAMVASSKGRSGTAWALSGFLFGPLALLAVGFMPAQEAGGARVPCPSCAEMILPNAKVCHFCGSAVQFQPRPIHPDLAAAAAAGIKRCAKCQRGNPPYATYCEFCGHDLAEKAAPAAMG